MNQPKSKPIEFFGTMTINQFNQAIGNIDSIPPLNDQTIHTLDDLIHYCAENKGIRVQKDLSIEFAGWRFDITAVERHKKKRDTVQKLLAYRMADSLEGSSYQDSLTQFGESSPVEYKGLASEVEKQSNVYNLDTGDVVGIKKAKSKSNKENLGREIPMSEPVDAVTAKKMEEERTYKSADEYGKKDNNPAPQMPFGSGPPKPGGPGSG